ncbi:MAG TPA: hypothetical protein DDW87_04685 [Firmicutes bacterium]|nr:hypothetical protein [Bacillota bacterium]
MDKPTSVISFHNYWIDNIVFEKNRSMQDYAGDVDFQLKVSYEHKERILLVSVGVELFDPHAVRNNSPFFLDVTVTGAFSINRQDGKEAIDEKVIVAALKSNTVAILFPYIRNIVSSLTLGQPRTGYLAYH